jgi:hypothetical protein
MAGGGTDVSGFDRIEFRDLMSTKTAKAMIRKLMRAFRKMP